MEDDILRRHLAALLYQFRDRPFLLAQYFITHEAISDNFKNSVVNNNKLSKLSDDMKNNIESEIPYFHNLEEMQKYYNSMFESKKVKSIHPILGASTKEEALRKQLNDALNNEDYELAVKIRDYMKELGIED